VCNDRVLLTHSLLLGTGTLYLRYGESRLSAYFWTFLKNSLPIKLKAGVTRSTMLQSKSCFLQCFCMFLVWPLQKQNQNHKQNCFCNMLLTSPQFDICFEAIVLSPIKSCHVTSWTQKVRSTQRWQPKRSTVGSLDQIWQIRSWHSPNTWNRLDAHEDRPKSKFDHAEVTSLVLLASYFALRHVVLCVFRSNGRDAAISPAVIFRLIVQRFWRTAVNWLTCNFH
jgi:hypothetical protein